MNNLPPIVKRQVPSQLLTAGWKLFIEKKFKHLDFVRDSYTAQFSDNRGTYWTVLRKAQSRSTFQTNCSCNTYLRHLNCHHLAAMFFIIYSKNPQNPNIEETLCKYYDQSIWMNLAKLSYEHWGDTLPVVKVNPISYNSQPTFELISSSNNDKETFRFILPEEHVARVVQKYRWQLFQDVDEKYLTTEEVESNLEILSANKTELEIRMNVAGYKSWLQKFEESFWFDFSKIWFLGFDDNGFSVNYSEQNNSLQIHSGSDQFSFFLPQSQIAKIIGKLAQNTAIRDTLNIYTSMAILNYSLKILPDHDLLITPVLTFDNDVEPLFLDSEINVKPVILGRYLYIQNKGFFPFERKIKYYDSNYFGLEEVRIPNDQIPKIISEYKKFIESGEFYYVSPSLLNKNISEKVKAVDIVVDDIQDDWLYLSVKYRIKNEIVSLYDIYHTLKSGKRFLIGEKVWIDLYSQDFNWIRSILSSDEIDLTESSENLVQLKMKKLNFIKLNAFLPKKGNIVAEESISRRLDHFTKMKPQTLAPSLEKCNYKLRDYQHSGYEWLWFLYENSLSGLLCDDMGLGKTYQSLSLIDGITFHVADRNVSFLVVCPTSVLSHWQDVLENTKKKVHLHYYHGSERELSNIQKEKYSIILTSYGVLRNDYESLAEIPFELAIFDEIQTAKNKASLTNAAMNMLNSKVKIGLTGTPIENYLTELKALFDIILPDYLGGDSYFRKNYISPIERSQNKAKLEELQRIIKPFMLRRTKSQVLLELPSKTEETRKCELTKEQAKLYQEVINQRAKSLIAQLYRSTENIPYIHIFSVLNHLKQICNHPAQLENAELDYNKYSSGKWDLFCELIDESLNSGFKIVVFSQYLRMLSLIENYLNDNNIEFATIKGSTKNRKEMIQKFNNDPDCKVFTGSLKASGFGINLTGGSVVIHYDRWWNAAREDQATDRVHRIGQSRGVQVFKLVTEGTLEEKIDRLILKKRQLMNTLVTEDEANIVKNFTREEMIELLTYDF